MTPKNLSKETLAAALLQLVEMSANGRTSELSELFNAVRKDGTVEDFYFQTIVEAWAEGHGRVLIDQRRLSSYRMKVRTQLKEIEKQKGFSALKAMWNGDLTKLRDQLFDEAEALTAECNALESRVAQLRGETFSLEALQIKVVEETATKCDQRIEAASKQASEVRTVAQKDAKLLVDEAAAKAEAMLANAMTQLQKSVQIQSETTANQQAQLLKWQSDAQRQVDHQFRSGAAALERIKIGLEQDIFSLSARRNALKEESFSSAIVDSRSP
jgi:cell division septum initiation protein DivIVA